MEGTDVREKQVCLVEDVTTTGGQIMESAVAMRDIGAKVDHVLCVIIRDEVAVERLKELGLELHYLFHVDELKAD